MRLLNILFSLYLLCVVNVQTGWGWDDSKVTTLEEETDEPTVDPTEEPFIIPPIVLDASVEGLCSEFTIDSNNYWDPVFCEIDACPGEVIFSQCNTAGQSGVPYCMGNTQLVLMKDNDQLDISSGSACGCPKIAYTFTESCRRYRIVQTCDPPQSDCRGQTAIVPSSMADDDGDDDATAMSPFSASDGGGQCEPFTVSEGVLYGRKCKFSSCGGSVTILQCPEDYTGTGSPTCTGSTKLSLTFDGPVLATDVSSGSCGCPKIVYTLPNICQTYEVLQACADGVTDCSGTTAVLATPVLGPVLNSAGAGGLCDPYSFPSGTGEQTCAFQSCGGSVTISQCFAGYTGLGSPSCTGSTKIRLTFGGSVLASAVSSGFCACSEIVYTLDNTCQTYEIIQECADGATQCTGTTAVYATSTVPVTEPTAWPTTLQFNADGVGGLCSAFTVSPSGGPSAYMCPFLFCGGSLTISQCDEGYRGDTSNGIPFCDEPNRIALHVDYAPVASQETANDACGCATIVYTLPMVCQAYQVHETCAYGITECAGRTAVYSTLSSDHTGGLCKPYSLSGSEEQVCSFQSCGGSVIISQCAEGYVGVGTPSCSSNSKLELSYQGQVFDADQNSGACGDCPEIVYTLDNTCRMYEVTQSCADGVNGCSGTTAVYTIATAPFDADANGGGLCDPFAVVNGYGGQTCEFTSCGGSFTITQCPEGYTGIGAPSCTGSSKLSLVFDGPVLATDTLSGSCGCPKIVYTLPNVCQTYEVLQACADGVTDCSGTTAVFATPIPPSAEPSADPTTEPTAEPTVEPSVSSTTALALSSDGAGGLCDFYDLNGGRTQVCAFESCGGIVKISQCGSGYTGAGSPACYGNTKLELSYQGHFFAADESSCGGYCPEIIYRLDDTCRMYELTHSCPDRYGNNGCAGITAVYTIATTTPFDADLSGGGLCDPFAVVNGYGGRTCKFTSCGGSVTITQCSGTPACTGSTRLDLYFGVTPLAGDEHTGTCGCSEIVYTLPDICQTYKVKQSCAAGEQNCAGTTAVFTAPPPPIDVDTGGGLCENFAIFDGVVTGRQVCEFTSCGGSVTITQCANIYTDAGTPTCGGSWNMLDLYFEGNLIVSRQSFDGIGPCGCPTIVTTLPDTCQTYQVFQSCDYNNCGGVAAVFATPAAPPVIDADNGGGLCEPFNFIDGYGTQVCKFKFCGGSITITQCPDHYTGDGTPTCTGSTVIYLREPGNGDFANDAGTASCGCSEIVYTLPDTCTTYEVAQSCVVGEPSCSGTTAVFATPIDANSQGGLCSPYQIVDGVGERLCEFTFCGGSVTITQCGQNYVGTGFYEPYCYSGDDYDRTGTGLELQNNTGGLLAYGEVSGLCGCPEITYMAPDDACYKYRVKQTCADGVDDCLGLTGVRATPPPPIDIDIDFAGGLCDPFSIADSSTGASRCQFRTCGGSLTISQCPLNYVGSGTPSCTGNTGLQFLDRLGQIIASNYHTGPCGCSEIVLDIGYGCDTYMVKQICAPGETSCEGTTAVFRTRLDVDSGGGRCSRFFIDGDYGEFDTCEFKSCGGKVVLTQCGSDDLGYPSWQWPYCTANTEIALYLNGTLIAADTNSGPCGCPYLEVELEPVCQVYQIRHACGNGVTSCEAVTAVFALPGPAPSAEPTAAPTLTPTVVSSIYVLSSDGAGGLCDPFSFPSGTGEQTCSFESCGGSVTITQCIQDYTGAGVPVCIGNTALELLLPGEGSLAFDEGGGVCGCSAIVYTLPNVCQTYEVIQSCAGSELNCAGATAVAATPPPVIDADVNGGALCEPFEIIDGEGERFCRFTFCGPSIEITQCSEGYTGAGSPSCEQTPMFELQAGDGTFLTSSNGNGDCGCPWLRYYAPYNSCRSYRLRQLCANGEANCAGTTAVYATPPPPPIDVDHGGGMCEPYSDSNGITTGRETCEFASCGGSVTITQCAEDYTGSGTPSCVNGNILELYFEEASLASTESGDSNGLCGCPTLVYTFANTCQTYQVLQRCQGTVCAGSTAVFTSYVPLPNADPTASPTRYSTVPHTYTVRNGFAFAVPTPNGDLFTLGEAPHGGLMDGNVNFNSFASPVSYIVASRFAFVAVLSDQTYVAWGAASALSGASPGRVYGVVANEAAFAGINMTTWGVFAFGSKHNGGDVLDDTRCNGFATQLSSLVLSLVASSCSFTALKSGGSVYTWGNPHCGGGISSETRTDLVNVQKVFATREAFAVILPGGVVKTWGGKYAGGDSMSVASELSTAEVVDIFASKNVFVAHTAAGGLIAWGFGPHGGDMSAVQVHLNSNAVHVVFTFTACAALKDDGDVYVWGRADSGGDASSVAGGLHNIVSLYGNSKAFAAVNTTGGVVTWGKAEYGGAIPADKASALASDVIEIFHTDRAFAALKQNGQLVVWGQAGHGGSPSPAIEALLVNGVHKVYSNDVGFAVVKQDGSVVAWGHPVSVPAPGVQLQSELLAIR